MAWRANGEVLCLADSAHGGIYRKETGSFFSADMPNVQIAAVKKCEDDEAFIRERIPEEDLLGFIHYNSEVIDADRQGKSPFDVSSSAVAEIKKIKEKLDA